MAMLRQGLTWSLHYAEAKYRWVHMASIVYPLRCFRTDRSRVLCNATRTAARSFGSSKPFHTTKQNKPATAKRYAALTKTVVISALPINKRLTPLHCSGHTNKSAFLKAQ